MKVLNCQVIRYFSIIFLTVLTLLFCYYYLPNLHDHEEEIINNKLPLIRKSKHKTSRQHSIFKIENRIVHLDLKGAPPKICFYSYFFPLLSQMGATGVLIEYEDMFPYNRGLLNNITAYNAYTLQDIETISFLAKENNLKLIPLVQTFGHLEFVLKLEEFKDYREAVMYPSVICPTYSKTLNLLEEMLTQVIDAHADIEIIHIGGNEVIHLGQCKICRNRLNNENLSKNDLYLTHINAIIRLLEKKYPKLKILAWDDHIQTMEQEDIENYKFSSNFHLAVWKSDVNVYDELGPSLWKMYEQYFPNIWAASAYKGAIGSNKYVSNINHYLQNQQSWLAVIKEYKNNINFNGIILTGRQRYDHFAVLCELLPMGIPVLAMSLRLLEGHKDSLIGPPLKVAEILKCKQPYGLIGSALGSPKCSFPGGEILENIIQFHQLEQDFEEITENSRIKGWLSSYNIQHVFSNPLYVNSVLMPLGKIKTELEQIKSKLSAAMLEMYDKYTVEEWIETYLMPIENKILTMWKANKAFANKESWPRQPITYHDEF